MKKQAYAALILAAVCSISSARRFHISNYYVKMFMNTSWPIWTYETTRNTNFFCQVDNVLNITEKSVCFNRSYWSSNWTTDTLEGTFDTSDLSTMLVGGIGMEKFQSERLEFASDNYTCGVFYVKPLTAGPGWRELRFKDVNETGKPEKECLDYFNKTGKAGYVIYRDNCTDLSLSVWPEY